MEITFNVPGIPVGKGRPRFTRSGFCYTPQKTTSYESDVKYAFLNSTGGRFIPIESTVSVAIDAIFPMPKSRKKGIDCQPKTTRPDIDNVIKSVCDALNGVAWRDDALIYQISAIKMESRIIQPCLKITIFY